MPRSLATLGRFVAGCVGVMGVGCSLLLESLNATFQEESSGGDAAAAPETSPDARDTSPPANRCTEAAGVDTIDWYRLTAPVPTPFDWFGHAGMISTPRIVVAAPSVFFRPTVGSVFSADVTRVPPELRSVEAFQPTAGDGVLPAFRLPYFSGAGASSGAFSVAIDGDTLAVGVAAADTDGAVDSGEVFVLTNDAGTWVLSQRLAPPTAQGCALFGRSVALDDGLLAVGAPGTALDGSSSCERVAEAASGKVYVFRHDGERFVPEEALLPPSAAGGEFFGESVDFGGGRLAVGAPSAILTDGDASILRAGAAYLFRKQDLGWTQEVRLENTGASEASAFGASVRVDDALLAIGAPLDDSCGGDEPVGAGGRVYVYRLSDDSWEADQCLLGTPNATPDLFGWALDLSATHLIVGAPFESSGAGAAYVFERNASQLSCSLRLEAPVREDEPFSSDEIFGAWVDASSEWWAVGAPRATVDGAFEGGAVFLFRP